MTSSPLNAQPCPLKVKENFDQYFLEWRRSSERQRAGCLQAIHRLLRFGMTHIWSSLHEGGKQMKPPSCVWAQRVREEALRLHSLWRNVRG